jgi:hypothetical protein
MNLKFKKKMEIHSIDITIIVYSSKIHYIEIFFISKNLKQYNK